MKGICSDNTAETRTDIEYAQLFADFQKRNTAVHIFKKTCQRNRIYRCENIVLIPVGVKTEAAFAVFFRFVEGEIGLLIQRGKGMGISCGKADTDAGSQSDGGAVSHGDLKTFAQRLPFLFHGMLCNPAGEKDDKLVAAQTADNIGCPELRGEDLRRTADRLITCLMSQRVINLLKIVKIYDKHGARFFGAHILQTFFYVLFGGNSVQKSGQSILGSAFLQLFKFMFKTQAVWGYILPFLHIFASSVPVVFCRIDTLHFIIMIPGLLYHKFSR